MGLGYVRDITLDLADKKIYWIDITEPRDDLFTLKIQRSDLNGINIQDIVTEKEVLAGWSLQIALDVEQRKIYWTHPDTIKWANLDGTNIQSVVTVPSRGISLDLDVLGKKIYYFATNKIRRMNLNGTNIQDIITVVSSIDLLVERGKMFWFLYEWNESNERMGQFWSAHLDGTKTQKIFTLGPELVTDFALSIPPDSPDFVVDSSQDVVVPRPDPPPVRPVVPSEPLPIPIEDVVSIPDANLAAAVRKALGLGANTRITKQAIEKLTRLDARESQIKNLTGLEHATQLRLLELRKNQIRDIRPLANLKKLMELILEVNDVRDISPLANLTQLTLLYIAANPISDFTPLANLTELRRLALWDNNISDVTLLADKVNLTHLYLWDNNISDISPLTNLTQLTLLYIERNQIRDVNPLVNLTKLTDLTLRGNPIADKSPLRILKERNPKLKLDIEIPQPSPIVYIDTAQRPPLYWIDTASGTLYRLVGTDVENLAPSVRNATDLAIDVTSGKLYWTEKTSDRTGQIRRANLDGTNVQLVKELTSVPHGIALDAADGKIYLTNSWGKVQRLNVDGSNFQSNLITGLEDLKDLAVDVVNHKVYWTEQTGENIGRVRRADLDGSNVELVKELNNVPHGIAVDPSNGKLYLTNSRGKVQRFNLDGSDFQWNFIVNLSSPQSIAVDVAEGKIYWTEKTGIRRANLDGTNIQDIVTGSGSANIVLGTPIAVDDMITMASPRADINEDGRINVSDLLLVVTALQGSETANPRADVNADGTVTTADLLLVIENLDDPVNASAPMRAETITSLDRVMLETQLNILLAQTDGSLRYQQAIAFLQTLLATTRPNKTRLLANYPNPFNPETWIPYQLADSSDVQILIYDTKGTVVRHLELGHQPAGYYTSRNRAAYWDGRNTLGERVASGIYFCQLQVGDFSLLRKMLIRK